MIQDDYPQEYNRLDPGLIDRPSQAPVTRTQEPVGRPAIVEQPTTQPSSGFPSMPSGEVTNTVLIGAFLAIVGNNLLKPLFALIIRNFESDQKATGDVVKLLKERINKLEAVNERQTEEHSKYLKSLDTANAQAANIAKILQNQTEHIEKMADSIRQLSVEVSDHRLEVQRQIDNISQHISGITGEALVGYPRSHTQNKPVKRSHSRG